MAGQYGYNGSAAAEQSFSRGNEYMVQAAGMQAQGLTNSAQLAAQSVREFHRMSQERDEFQLRAQQADMEMQLNRQKLADMQAVDAVTMSRKQIELISAQIDAAKQEMQIRGEDFEYSKSIRGYTTGQKMIAAQQAQAELEKTLINNGTYYRDDSGELQPVKNAKDKQINAQQREELIDPLTKAKISKEQESIEYTKVRTDYMTKKAEYDKAASEAKTQNDRDRLDIMREELDIKRKQAQNLLERTDASNLPAAVRTRLFDRGELMFDPNTSKLRAIDPNNPEDVKYRDSMLARENQTRPSFSQMTELLKYYDSQIEQEDKKLNSLITDPNAKEEALKTKQKLIEQRNRISQNLQLFIDPASQQSIGAAPGPKVDSHQEALEPETVKFLKLFDAQISGSSK